jgi:hypothetical protein
MRQVNHDEFVDRIQAAIGRWPRYVLKGLGDHRPTERLRAQLQGAEIIAAALNRLEILTDSPLGPPIRYADLDGGSGVPAQDDVEPNGPMR